VLKILHVDGTFVNDEMVLPTHYYYFVHLNLEGRLTTISRAITKELTVNKLVLNLKCVATAWPIIAMTLWRHASCSIA